MTKIIFGLFILPRNFFKKQRQNNVDLYSAAILERKLFQNCIYDRSLNIFMFCFPNCLHSFGCASKSNPSKLWPSIMTRTIEKQGVDHSDEVKLWLQKFQSQIYFAFIKLKVLFWDGSQLIADQGLQFVRWINMPAN